MAVDEEVEKLQKELEEHLKDNRRGERLRDGVQVVLAGATNAGKSSLLNVISKYLLLLSFFSFFVVIIFGMKTNLCSLNVRYFSQVKLQHLFYGVDACLFLPASCTFLLES